jgi:hypothetical protein
LSRPVVGIEDSACITLDPDHHGQVSADVEVFIRSKIQVLSQRLGIDTKFETNVVHTLLEKSEGTFLWVGFVVAELLKKRTRSQVQKALGDLPKGLPGFYVRMLQKLSQMTGPIVRNSSPG